jgi:hypothetical protein
VEDIAKEVGLKYAESLPAALAVNVAILVVLGWLAIWTDRLEESSKRPARIALALAALFIIVQMPAAYSAAEDYCREEWENAGGTPMTFDAPYPYTVSKCMSVWPHGPDWG